MGQPPRRLNAVASPIDEELVANFLCNKDGKGCINQWRENKCSECSEVAPMWVNGFRGVLGEF